jgi:integrase
VLTGVPEYREQMLRDIQTYTNEIAKQEKTDTQKENWLETNVLKQKLEQYKKNAAALYRKKSLSTKDLQDIQNYILLVLYSGSYIAPRRSKDYCDFKIADIDKEKENYVDKSGLVFNSYKTSSKYGQQRVQIPPQMRNILKKWITVNPTPYLLFDSNQAPLTSVKLNQRLNSIFGKKISVNALRHTFLTSKYGDVGSDLNDMGTSMNMMTTYIKK